MNKEIIPPIGADENSYTLGYINGYTDCEVEKEDLAPTWQDMEEIVGIADTMLRECHDKGIEPKEVYPEEEVYYKEVLRRFNEMKEEKK